MVHRAQQHPLVGHRGADAVRSQTAGATVDACGVPRDQKSIVERVQRCGGLFTVTQRRQRAFQRSRTIRTVSFQHRADAV
ncbi:hypothetical protein DMA12_15310 [Amycolatopsis balhimycina DSM 5908]|uniref:Uncharacterized protein n=1 Tax=Amycolatopsis balhimycina DSM 5908 TaxID=1081091 RepID=A0A428WPC4_AMYBA|nr:hypothetical protein DMA12_15310 [Amycolatopsis balhimycina DSM 5908]